MKNIITILTMLVFAGVCLAQSTATTTQTGDLNEAVITQTGNANKTTINQVGDKNNDGYWISSGAATVAQTGDENIAEFTQIGDDNEEMILQEGDRNTAILEQTGDWGYGYMQQKGNGASDNYVKVVSNGNSNRHFTVTSWGNSNEIFTTQVGNSNEAFTGQYVGSFSDALTVQYGDGNTTNIQQSQGDQNMAYIDQGTESSTVIDNLATIYQYNGLNTTRLLQIDDYNTATINQTGTVNMAQLTQSGGGIVTVDQEGNYNVVQGLAPAIMQPADPMAYFSGSNLDVDQTNNNNVLSLSGNGEVIVSQMGSDIATVIQSGGGYVNIDQQIGTDGSNAAINQSGSGTAYFTQKNGTSNFAALAHGGIGRVDILQDGSENIVSGEDKGYDPSDPIPSFVASFDGATLNVLQEGNSNELFLRSSGAGCIVDVDQIGGHTATVNQLGLSNTATVLQQTN